MGFEYSYLQLESKWMIQRFWAILPVGNHWKQGLCWVETPNWYPEIIHLRRFPEIEAILGRRLLGGLERAWCPGPRKHMYPSLPVSLISGLISLQHDQILVILVVFLPVAMFQHVPVDINYTSTSSESSLQNITLIRQQVLNLAHNLKKKKRRWHAQHTQHPAFISSIARLLDPSWTSMVHHSLCNDPADQADRYFTK